MTSELTRGDTSSEGRQPRRIWSRHGQVDSLEDPPTLMDGQVDSLEDPPTLMELMERHSLFPQEQQQGSAHQGAVIVCIKQLSTVSSISLFQLAILDNVIV